ncbi:MAG: hypothetical protein K2P74_04815 [Nitrosomonas sp.]|nr:hypothetical protein [Nitrosomonas sp.]
MQKIDKHQSKSYGPLVLWRGDLENIFSIFGEASVSKINIESGDTKFDSPNEFLEHSSGDTISELKIFIHNPFIQIDLSKHWVRLFASSSDLQSAGLFSKVDSVLSDCERKPRFLHKYVWFFLFMTLTFSLSYFPIFKPFAYYVPALLILVVFWSIYITFSNFKTSIIRIFHKKYRPNFFIRNRDSIVIAIFSALLGGVLTYFVPKMIEISLQKNIKVEEAQKAPQSE